MAPVYGEYPEEATVFREFHRVEAGTCKEKPVDDRAALVQLITPMAPGSITAVVDPLTGRMTGLTEESLKRMGWRGCGSRLVRGYSEEDVEVYRAFYETVGGEETNEGTEGEGEGEGKGEEGERERDRDEETFGPDPLSPSITGSSLPSSPLPERQENVVAHGFLDVPSLCSGPILIALFHVSSTSPNSPPTENHTPSPLSPLVDLYLHSAHVGRTGGVSDRVWRENMRRREVEGYVEMDRRNNVPFEM